MYLCTLCCNNVIISKFTNKCIHTEKMGCKVFHNSLSQSSHVCFKATKVIIVPLKVIYFNNIFHFIMLKQIDLIDHPVCFNKLLNFTMDNKNVFTTFNLDYSGYSSYSSVKELSICDANILISVMFSVLRGISKVLYNTKIMLTNNDLSYFKCVTSKRQFSGGKNI